MQKFHPFTVICAKTSPVRYNGDMMNRLAPATPSNLEKTTRVLITVASTLLMLLGIGLLINYFYAMTALLGIVLIITYILLGPVNLMEKGINGLSSCLGRLPLYSALIQKSPEANPRILAVTVVYAAFFMTLVIGSIEFLPILTSQIGDMGQKVGVQLLDASDQAISWADKNIGKGTLRNLFAQNIRQAEQQGVLKQHSGKGKPVTDEERQVIQKTVIESTLIQLENFLSSAVPTFISLVVLLLFGRWASH
jgi:predicted PurR-regulated permease PerM